MVRVKPKDGGALFRRAVDNGDDRTLRAPARPTPQRAGTDWKALAEGYTAAMPTERLAELAGQLGVTTTALQAVGVGHVTGDELQALRARWEGDSPDVAFTFPERDGSGRIIGLLLRAPDGRKSTPTGSKRGVVVPNGIQTRPDPVLIVEGASDVAACEVLGLAAVGRPSNSGGAEILAELLDSREVLAVGENDAKDGGLWPGRDGAESVAQRLATDRGESVKWTLPPDDAKDVRGWLQARIAGGLDLSSAEGCMAAGAELLTALLATARPEKIESRGGAKVERRCAYKLDIVRLADVAPGRVSWLWPGRIARKKLTLIAGDPGLGKSFVTLDVAARVSRGEAWPDAPGIASEPGSVILLSAEDDPGDTIRPRLDAAGADVSRIGFLRAVKVRNPETGNYESTPFTLSDDLHQLEFAIGTLVDCKLIVIDPISAYMGGGPRFDSHRNSDVRNVLAPLSDLAARAGIAVVAVTHLRKGEGAAMYRAMGSLAFVAAARVVWAIAKDNKDETGQRRLMLPIKCNVSVEPKGLAFHLRPQGDTAVVVWSSEQVEVSADEALAPPARKRGPDSDDRDEAVKWLRAALAQGPRRAAEVVDEAKHEAGIAKRTLDRARKILKVRAYRPIVPGAWWWSLLICRIGHGSDSNAEKPGNLGILAESAKERGYGQGPEGPETQDCQDSRALGNGTQDNDGASRAFQSEDADVGEL